MRSTSTNSAAAILVKARERRSIANSSSIFLRRLEGDINEVVFSFSDALEDGGFCSSAWLPPWSEPNLTGSGSKETVVGIRLSTLNSVWDFA